MGTIRYLDELVFGKYGSSKKIFNWKVFRFKKKGMSPKAPTLECRVMFEVWVRVEVRNLHIPRIRAVSRDRSSI